MIIYDSVMPTHKHALLIPYGSDKLFVKAVAKGGYNLFVNDSPIMDFSNEKEMLDYILLQYPA